MQLGFAGVFHYTANQAWERAARHERNQRRFKELWQEAWTESERWGEAWRERLSSTTLPDCPPTSGSGGSPEDPPPPGGGTLSGPDDEPTSGVVLLPPLPDIVLKPPPGAVSEQPAPRDIGLGRVPPDGWVDLDELIFCGGEGVDDLGGPDRPGPEIEVFGLDFGEWVKVENGTGPYRRVAEPPADLSQIAWCGDLFKDRPEGEVLISHLQPATESLVPGDPPGIEFDNTGRSPFDAGLDTTDVQGSFEDIHTEVLRQGEETPPPGTDPDTIPGPSVTLRLGGDFQLGRTGLSPIPQENETRSGFDVGIGLRHPIFHEEPWTIEGGVDLDFRRRTNTALVNLPPFGGQAQGGGTTSYFTFTPMVGVEYDYCGCIRFLAFAGFGLAYLDYSFRDLAGAPALGASGVTWHATAGVGAYVPLADHVEVGTELRWNRFGGRGGRTAAGTRFRHEGDDLLSVQLGLRLRF